jgi:hypothetical protein
MSLPSLPEHTSRQLDLLSSQLDELKAYLLSPELFWPLGGPIRETPRLTLGNLLFNLRTLKSGSSMLESAQQIRLTRLESIWEAAQTRWESAIAKKALQEMGARLNLWRGYLDDLSEGLGGRLNYATEVRNRVLFELLIPLAARDEAYDEMLAAMHSLDQRFVGLSTPADFVWNEAYRDAFPKPLFDQLYRRPDLES